MSSGRIETIQALRFAAASLVVLVHCASGYFIAGGAGVDVFFVISGFIISRVMRNRGANDFVLDRLTRIYPIYWIALTPFIFILWNGSINQFLTSVTLWPYFGDMQISFLTVGWTLSFELLFYFGVSLILWRRSTFLFLILAYAVCFALGAYGAHPLFGYFGSPMVLEFLMGILIARMPNTQFKLIGLLVSLASIIAIPLLAQPAFGIPFAMFTFTSRAFSWGMPAALLVWGALQWEGAFEGPLWRLIVLGGEASYSLYLFHPSLLLLAPANPYLRLAIMPIFCVLASFLIYRWIEKPLTKVARRALGRAFKSVRPQPQ